MQSPQELVAELAEICREHPDVTAAGGVNDDTLSCLSAAFLPSEATKLLRRCPALATVQLRSWLVFLGGYGFSRSQTKHMLLLAPEAFVTATLLTAADTLRACQRLQLPPRATVQLLTCYPQLLHMDEAHLKAVLQMVAQHQPLI